MKSCLYHVVLYISHNFVSQQITLGWIYWAWAKTDFYCLINNTYKPIIVYAEWPVDFILHQRVMSFWKIGYSLIRQVIAKWAKYALVNN